MEMLPSLAGPVIGGLLGSDGSSSQQSVQNKIDPRMDPYIYGSDGILPNAAQWYSQNRTGLNNQMLTGLNNQWNQLGASGQGYNQMQNLGLSLMGGVAGNPFTQGGTSGGSQSGSAAYTPAQSYQPAQMSMGNSNPFTMPNITAPAAPQQAAAPGNTIPAPMQDWWNDINSGRGSA